MIGTLEAADIYFARPDAVSSAHFAVGLDGRIQQYVALTHGAFANGLLEQGNRWDQVCNGTCDPKTNPNLLTVAIDTEDKGNIATPVSDAQFNAVLSLCKVVKQEFSSIQWLVTHSVISPISRPNCPGPRWIASGRFQALADALSLKAIA
jgi:N-acetyl-anhydromuramyl-L-alanine amidase AmpD